MKFIANTTDRLDKYLTSQVSVSRGLVQKAIKAGKVTINGAVVSEADHPVKPAAVIELPELELEDLKPSEIEMKVGFEDSDRAVIDEQAGMVVSPGAVNKESTLPNALFTKYPANE